MVIKRKATKRKTKGKPLPKVVVTGKFTLMSGPVSKTRADQLTRKIRANGGTATKRKA